MIRPRVIPTLLLKGRGLVKTIKFSAPKYIGDPRNAVKIFNEKEVDELVLLDIDATPERRRPQFELISQIAGECFMPLGYGGGISSMDDIRALFRLGVEKVIINTAAVCDPGLVEAAVKEYGGQSIVGCIDFKKKFFGGYSVYIKGGRRDAGVDPVEHASRLERLGVGEIMLNSIDRDGMRCGYDLALIKKVTAAVSVPVIASGGAAGIADLVAAIKEGGASAAAAGSMFVLHGERRAVLITYPTAQEMSQML